MGILSVLGLLALLYIIYRVYMWWKQISMITKPFNDIIALVTGGLS